jgi:hypothetical protein
LAVVVTVMRAGLLSVLNHNVIVRISVVGDQSAAILVADQLDLVRIDGVEG